MAQTGYTPIQLYYSTTASTVPLAANLAAGELAINTTDEKLYFKNASGTVKLLASSASTVVAGSNTQVIYNNAGAYAGSANLTFNGTTLTAAALTSTGVATFSAGTVSAPAITTAGDTNTGIFFPAADTIAFTEGGVESMRIDSSGNVGIGLTPISGTTTGKLQLTGGVQLNTNNDGVFGNVYFASGWKYAGNGSAGYIKFGVSSAVALALGASANNSSGAGATANPSEILNITSAGLVGIGTTGPGTQLGVGNATDQAQLAGGLAGATSVLYLGSPNNGSGGQATLSYVRSTGVTSLGPSTTGGALGSALNIDGSGNVGIGTNSPSSKLQVSCTTNFGFSISDGVASGIFTPSSISTNSIALFSTSNHPLIFGTNNTERMRIDTTGNITVSKASRGTITTDNDLSFDMNAASNFSCTPTAGGALTFTNITAGQSGYILLVNNSNYAITAAATTKVGSSFLSTISTTGTYLISYFSNGTNVYVTTSGALS